MHPSEQVLERLSGALGLSTAERDYLFMLAQHRPPPLVPSTGDELRPAIRRMLEALHVPALIHTRRWDIVAWNKVWPRCFLDFSTRPAEDRNLLKILLTGADFNRDPTEHDQSARRVLAKARLDYSQSAADPARDERRPPGAPRRLDRYPLKTCATGTGSGDRCRRTSRAGSPPAHPSATPATGRP